MCAQGFMAGSQSSSFPVEVGVKQGCANEGIEYRLDGGLLDLRRLQAKSKTSSAMISALQFADDAALLLTDFSIVLMSCLTSVQAF